MDQKRNKPVDLLQFPPDFVFDRKKRKILKEAQKTESIKTLKVLYGQKKK